MGAIIIGGMADPNVLLNLMVRAVVACWGYYMWPSHTAPTAPSYPDRAARLASLFSEQDDVCLCSFIRFYLWLLRRSYEFPSTHPFVQSILAFNAKQTHPPHPHSSYNDPDFFISPKEISVM